MRSRRLALALALVALAPGCISTQLWEWAREEDVDHYGATGIEQVAPAPDGGFVVHLRMADGSPRTQQWPGEDARGPAAAYAEACRAAQWRRDDEAVAALERAVHRGLARRDFATDPALARIAERPEVARLAAEPVSPPELILREQENASGLVEIVHLAPPEPPDGIIDVEPVSVEVWRGGPLGYTAAVLATPVTFALDVVTFPAQVVIVLWVIDNVLSFD